jgi:sugar-specific transcriptional regulator TrmB
MLDITKTQLYKVYKLLDKYGEMTVPEIAKRSRFPIPSVRRVLSQLDEAGKLEKKFIYKLKEDTQE